MIAVPKYRHLLRYKEDRKIVLLENVKGEKESKFQVINKKLLVQITVVPKYFS